MSPNNLVPDQSKWANDIYIWDVTLHTPEGHLYSYSKLQRVFGCPDFVHISMEQDKVIVTVDVRMHVNTHPDQLIILLGEAISWLHRALLESLCEHEHAHTIESTGWIFCPDCGYHAPPF